VISEGTDVFATVTVDHVICYKLEYVNSHGVLFALNTAQQRALVADHVLSQTADDFISALGKFARNAKAGCPTRQGREPANINCYDWTESRE
jgi:hypothetical protein